jgi:hypothetical protein
MTPQRIFTKESSIQASPQPIPTLSTFTQTTPIPPASTQSMSTQTAPSLFALPALSSTLSCQPPPFGFPSFSFGPSAPAPCQRTHALSDSQPQSLAPPLLPTLPLAFPPAPTMTSRILTGLAAMPHATKMPSFNGATGKPIIDFLIDYNEIMDGHNLTDQQKVEFVLKYIPPSHKDLWKSLKGYATGDWTTFQGELEKLYPDMDAAAQYSRQALYDLVNMLARTRMRDEKDIFDYYRRFLAISNPLHSDRQISSDERNSEFFRGFNSYNRTSIANQLYPLHPNRPHNKPYDYKDVFSVAQVLRSVGHSVRCGWWWGLP